MSDGQQRPADRVPQRELERLHDQLLHRRHLRRRRRPRVGPRLHRVHLRPDLPVAVRRAQRGLLRHLGRDPRPDQQPRGRRRGRPRPPSGATGLCSAHPRRHRRDINAPTARRRRRARALPRPPSARSFTPAGVTVGRRGRHRRGQRRRPDSTTDGCTADHQRRRRRRQVGLRRPRHLRLPGQGPQRPGRRRQRPSSSATAAPAALSVSGDDAAIYGLDGHPADGTRIKSAGGPVNVHRCKDAGPRQRRLLPLADRREVAGLRRRDPRHVEPHLLRRPGQGQRRGVQLHDRRQRRRARQLGVPNHGYALLVDGGTYNGVTVTGLGLDKAAEHLLQGADRVPVPTSDFVDHADSLEAACDALVDRPINKITVERNTSATLGARITAADCGEVSKMVDAVQLRKDPTAECDFKPILAPAASPPSLAATARRTRRCSPTTSRAAWPGGPPTRRSSTPEPRGGRGRPPTRPPVTTPVASPTGPTWATVTARATRTTSPAVTRSSARPSRCPCRASAPRLSFDHYVATETGYDGGNVK